MCLLIWPLAWVGDVLYVLAISLLFVLPIAGLLLVFVFRDRAIGVPVMLLTVLLTGVLAQAVMLAWPDEPGKPAASAKQKPGKATKRRPPAPALDVDLRSVFPWLPALLVGGVLLGRRYRRPRGEERPRPPLRDSGRPPPADPGTTAPAQAGPAPQRAVVDRVEDLLPRLHDRPRATAVSADERRRIAAAAARLQARQQAAAQADRNADVTGTETPEPDRDAGH